MSTLPLATELKREYDHRSSGGQAMPQKSTLPARIHPLSPDVSSFKQGKW